MSAFLGLTSFLLPFIAIIVGILLILNMKGIHRRLALLVGGVYLAVGAMIALVLPFLTGTYYWYFDFHELRPDGSLQSLDSPVDCSIAFFVYHLGFALILGWLFHRVLGRDKISFRWPLFLVIYPFVVEFLVRMNMWIYALADFPQGLENLSTRGVLNHLLGYLGPVIAAACTIFVLILVSRPRRSQCDSRIGRISR